MRMDFAAVKWSMEEHGVRPGHQLPVFRLVSMLHDVRYNRERTIGWYCQAHSWDLDSDASHDPDCGRCRMSLGG